VRRLLLLNFVLVLSPGVCAQPSLVRTEALDAPSKHAWNLFMLLNHPAKDPKTGRGIPDTAKPLGAPGSTSVWETWRLAKTEVFLKRGVEPPAWDDLRLPGGPTTGRVPEEPKPLLVNRAQARPKGGFRILFDEDGIWDPKTGGGFGETRMNRALYEAIKANKLYSKEGQQRYAAEAVKGSKPLLSFPVDSMEVKAAWRSLTQDEIKQGKDKTYYVAEWEGQKYGLITLHIITKDVPNWFWATFHHKDNPSNEFEKEDLFPKPKAVIGTVWENYVLGGTQTDFMTAQGDPIILSDFYVENGFLRSSCISCHSLASAAPPNEGSLSPDSFLIGPPNPALFFKDQRRTQLRIIQTDFLWSLPIRAKSEKESDTGSATK